MTDAHDYRHEARREDRRWSAIGVLAFIAAIEALVIGALVLEVDENTTKTAEAVELLEGRTPLFGELQAAEERVVCISELDARLGTALAAGLVAVAADDDVGLARAAASVATARNRLALLGTDRDPCTR